MTLVIAAQGRDFVVLGTDSRGTLQELGGTRVEINIVVKLVPIAKHVAILLYGEAQLANYLIEKFRSTLKRQTFGVREIAEKVANICREETKKVKDVQAHPRYFPNFGFVIAGLNKSGEKYNVPRCYSLRSATGFRLGSYTEGFAIEGKPIIALYMFAKNYRSDMQVDELCGLVAQALYDTMRIDGDVGGEIKMAIIDSAGLRELDSRDIRRDLIREWGTSI